MLVDLLWGWLVFVLGGAMVVGAGWLLDRKSSPSRRDKRGTS